MEKEAVQKMTCDGHTLKKSIPCCKPLLVISQAAQAAVNGCKCTDIREIGLLIGPNAPGGSSPAARATARILTWYTRQHAAHRAVDHTKQPRGYRQSCAASMWHSSYEHHFQLTGFAPVSQA
eukprot:scaffold9107_cov19-Tisochrysis_lutea.AAC.1